MPPPLIEIARREQGQMTTGMDPVRLTWTIADLISSDHHKLSAKFTCGIRAINDLVELKLLEETFLPIGTDWLGSATVIEHFTPLLRRAAEQLAGSMAVQASLDDSSRDSWITALRKAGEELAFSCGLELVAPWQIQLSSPTLEVQKSQRARQSIAEQQATDRLRHFQHASDLLKQWQAMLAASPNVQPGQLIRQVSSADQAAMLESLLASDSQQTPQDLWAVAGDCLLRIDGHNQPPAIQTIKLPDEAGPLRSVRIDDDQLLIGARSGVLRVATGSPELATLYQLGDMQSEHGFSRVIHHAERLWACHRDAGLVAWNFDETSQPSIQLPPPALGGSPRLIASDGSSLLFVVENRLVKLDTDRQVRAIYAGTVNIRGLLRTEEYWIITTDDGQVIRLNRQTFEKEAESRPMSQITSAALLPWLNTFRLLLCGTSGPILCLGLDDDLVTQYASNHVGFRGIVAAPASVAALSADRQRIILWQSWNARQPVAEIHAATAVRHRVADLAFAAG